MNRVRHVTPLQNYKLQVEFEDGVTGQVDLRARLFGPMFEPLRDRTLFAQVAIDDYGVVSWPNGADLDPNVLWKQISSSSA